MRNLGKGGDHGPPPLIFTTNLVDARLQNVCHNSTEDLGFHLAAEYLIVSAVSATITLVFVSFTNVLFSIKQPWNSLAASGMQICSKNGLQWETNMTT